MKHISESQKQQRPAIGPDFGWNAASPPPLEYHDLIAKVHRQNLIAIKRQREAHRCLSLDGEGGAIDGV